MNPSEIIQSGIEMFLAGGMIMYMLGVVAFILYATAFGTLVFVMRGNLGDRDDRRWHRWINDPSGAEGRMGEALCYALHGPKLTAKIVHRRFVEVRETILSSIDRRLLVVNTLIAAAPLAGLLGTVMGMLAMFAGLSEGKGATGMQRIAAGMQQALITTQTGLTIALPGLFIVLIVKSKRNGIAAALTRLESLVLTTRFQRNSST